jgi:hypothetical protein
MHRLYSLSMPLESCIVFHTHSSEKKIKNRQSLLSSGEQLKLLLFITWANIQIIEDSYKISTVNHLARDGGDFFVWNYKLLRPNVHVHAAWPSPYASCISLPMSHAHIHSACPCPSFLFMSMLHFHDGCSCCVAMLRVPCMPVLHVQTA